MQKPTNMSVLLRAKRNKKREGTDLEVYHERRPPHCPLDLLHHSNPFHIRAPVFSKHRFILVVQPFPLLRLQEGLGPRACRENLFRGTPSLETGADALPWTRGGGSRPLFGDAAEVAHGDAPGDEAETVEGDGGLDLGGEPGDVGFVDGVEVSVAEGVVWKREETVRERVKMGW